MIVMIMADADEGDLAMLDADPGELAADTNVEERKS